MDINDIYKCIYTHVIYVCVCVYECVYIYEYISMIDDRYDKFD